MPLLGILSWSQYTVPAGIPSGDLTDNTHPNDPANPTYDAANPVSWIGETSTFNGGAPTQIDITDDDASFDDGYMDPGSAQTLTSVVSSDGTPYPARSTVENAFSLVDAGGQEIFVVRINGQNVGFTYANGQEPTMGETFTASQSLDGAPADNAGGATSSSASYSNVICFAAGTLIDTPLGPRPVETLMPGDEGTTRDHGPTAILWRRQSDLCLEHAQERDAPVLIAAGALPCTGRYHLTPTPHPAGRAATWGHLCHQPRGNGRAQRAACPPPDHLRTGGSGAR